MMAVNHGLWRLLQLSRDSDSPVGFLIEYDCAGALKPKKVVSGEDHDLFVVKNKLGWGTVGPTVPLNSPGNTAGYCHRISSKEIPPITPTSIIIALEMYFFDMNPKEKTVTRRHQILHHNKGHLEMPLPFRVRHHIPKNKHLAEVRMKHLKTKIGNLEKITSNLRNDILMKEMQRKSMTHQMTAVHCTFLTIEYSIQESPKKLGLCSIALLNSGTHHWMSNSWQDLI